MFRKLALPSLFVALASVFTIQLVHAQSVDIGRHSRPRITQDIDERELVTLRGNTHPDARKENDRGKVEDGFPMQHMQLQLQRSPEQEEVVQEFISALHRPHSPEFHQWITADEFGERFGVAEQDLGTLTRWLVSHGFKINLIYPSGMVIDFSGTAEQVKQAFGTEIHYLEIRGERHIGNIRDPQIPVALASVVAGVVSMHDFRPHAMHKMRSVQPKFTVNGLFGATYALVPGDLATIYNLNPLFSAGYSGQGQTIALVEDTDVFSAADWSTFRSKFGLSGYTPGSFQIVHPASPTGPNNCTGPGVIAPNDAEAILDAEWASAAAPSATVEIASCADTTTTFGGLIAIQNLINASSAPPAIMSVSYGQCETVNGAAANAAYNSAYQQAVAEGVSVFVAAGDSGADGCDNSAAEATHGIGANAFASTPYNVAVGGTDFSDTYSGTSNVYWNSTNTSVFSSATSYIPEIPWNNSCAGALLSNYLGFGLTYGSTSLCNDSFYGSSFQTTVAGGGSPSACATGAPSVPGVVGGTCQGWPKPPWQSVLGNPNDGVRDTPDISLFAADGLWSHYYVFCWSDTANGGAACTGDPGGWSGAGGTSFSAPILAGIQALVNQKMGSPQGNPDPVYYQLAAAEYGSSGNAPCNSTFGSGVSSACIFYDVTQGDIDVNCTGNNNCYDPSGPSTQGVLSTSNNSFSAAYGTTTGWDFATGIGTLNATNLVTNWPVGGPSPGFALFTSPSSVTITQSGSGASTITVVPRNGFNGSVSLSASGLPSGITASFNPASTANTSTLTLTASSTAAVGTSNVTITGTAGPLTSTTTVSLTVNSVGTFTLSASPNNLSVFEAASGTSTITVTPQNGFNGNVSLSASGLPSGITASFNPTSTTSTSALTLTASGAASIGTFTVTITGSAGSLTNSTTITLSILPPLNPYIPSGWSDLDVGSVSKAGTASYSNGVFTLTASGQYIYSTADGMHFAYQPLNGDGTIVARVLSASGSQYPEAGVMIRETLNNNSAHAFMAYEPYPSAATYFYERPSTGAATSSSTALIPALPYWVKLVRSGSSFSGFISADGVNWVQVGSTQTISMAQNVYIGLALSANNNSAVASASFDNVSLNSAANPAPSITNISPTSGNIGAQVVISGSGFGPQSSSVVLLNGIVATVNSWSSTSITTSVPTAATSGPLVVCVAPTMNCSNPLTFTVILPLPSGWLDQDVGQVNTAGTTKYSNSVFTLTASGQWIYSTADGMHFAYQPLNGDGTIVARVLSASGSQYPEAGVMIRETLNNNSAHAFMAYEPYPSAATYFYERPSTGAATSSSTALIPALPYWVKLVRSGNSFSGFISADGVNWVQAGSTQTISMAQNVYIGLALSANNNSAVATASFDNVSITLPPPSYALSALPAGVSVTQGSNATSTITVVPRNGFNGSVSLSASGLPSGITASFNPASTANTSTLTLTASSTAAVGTSNVTITGTAGPLTSTTTVSLTVNSVGTFTLSASPNNLSVFEAASGTSTITVTPQNGFNGNVSLSASGLPSGVTASFNPTSTANTSTLTFTASGKAAVGTSNVTITGTASALTRTATITLSILPLLNPIPSGWSDLDVGSVSKAGTASYSNGVFTLTASGQYIYSTADGMHFAYQPLNGDGMIVARVLSASGSQYPEAGVMIRETLNSNSAHAFMAYEPYPSAATYFYERPSTGANTSSSTATISALPYWVKAVRSGSSFSGYISADGVNWVQVGSTQTISMAQSVYIGLALSANNNSAVATASFDNVSIGLPPPSYTLSASPATVSVTQGSNVTSTITVVPRNGFNGSVSLSASGLPSGITASFNPTGTTSTSALTLTASGAASIGTFTVTITGSAGSLTNSTTITLSILPLLNPIPSGWSDLDVGSVSKAGTASYSNGVFTLTASGQWIYSTADGMHFAYQPLNGDGTIVARVLSASGSQYPEAGVMIRETLNNNSAHAFMAYEPYPSAATYFYERPSTGAATSSSTALIPALPYWVKLVRSGNSFSGFISADGVNWVQVGSTQTISMAQNVYIGLALSANNNSAVATASFDNVSVTH